MALRLSPTSYPYLHTFSLPRTLLLAVPDTTRRPHLPSLTFSSSLAGCAWHFKDSLSSYGEKSFPFVPFFPPFFRLSIPRSPSRHRSQFSTSDFPLSAERWSKSVSSGGARYGGGKETVEEEVVFNAYVLRPIVAAGYRPLLIILREFRHDHPPRTGGGKKHPVYSVRKKDSFPLPLPLIRV